MKRFFILLLIIVFTLTGCNKVEDTVVAEEAYTAVEVEALGVKNLHLENIFTAKTFADKEVYVIPVLPGKVDKINVKVGDTVQKNDILIILNKDDINKQVNQAYAAYESAKAGYEVSKNQIQSAKDSFERIEKLYKEGAVAQTQYEQAKLAASDDNIKAAQKGVEQAKIAYENAASALDNAAIKAPISGVISTLNVVEGEYVSSARPPITIVDSDSITVELGVPGNLVNKIKQGDKVTIEINSADFKGEAVINSISTSSDPMTNLYKAEIILENNGHIKPGMFAKVYLFTDKIENVFAVKTEAVKETNDKKFVFVAEGDHAVLKEVTAGLDTGTYIEIKEGLNEGDKVIVKGQDYVTDGCKIKVVRGE